MAISVVVLVGCLVGVSLSAAMLKLVFKASIRRWWAQARR